MKWKKIVEIKNLIKTFCKKGDICVANQLNLDLIEGWDFHNTWN